MNNKISKESADKYDLLLPMLNAIYNEMKELSKKKPDSPLNEYKVKSINRVLEPIKDLFQYEETSLFLDILDLDEMPTNSDVVMILSQYVQSMKLYKERYYFRDSRDGVYKWRT